jgi:hypothetical protein
VKRLAIAGFVAWLIVLAIVFRPHGHGPPPITHAHLLDPSDRNLPTLPPLPTSTSRP